MISDTIKQLRKSHGLTQAQVAECLRLERSTYAYYEGGRVPNVDILLRLCALYKITLEFLITGEENFSRTYLHEGDDGLNNVPHILLSDDEKKLVLLFRLCEDKQAVLAYVQDASVKE